MHKVYKLARSEWNNTEIVERVSDKVLTHFYNELGLTPYMEKNPWNVRSETVFELSSRNTKIPPVSASVVDDTGKHHPEEVMK